MRAPSTAPMKARATSHIRKLATDVHDAFPEMDVHQHLTDAARELDSGRTQNAQRHIHAAIFGLTPLQLRRHGILDDGGHNSGKAFMQRAHRGLLLTKDLQDVKAANNARSAPPDDDQEPDVPDTSRSPLNGQPVPARNLSWEQHYRVIELVAQHESAAGRRALQAKGHTAYGTSFPVPNVSYLHKALKAVGRVKPGKRGVLKRFLQKRAAQLGVTSHLKGTWADPAPSQASLAIGLEDFSSIDLARGGGAKFMAAMHAARAKAHATASRHAHDTASRTAHAKMAALHAKIAGSLKNADDKFGDLVKGSAVARGEGAVKFANPGPPPFVMAGPESMTRSS